MIFNKDVSWNVDKLQHILLSCCGSFCVFLQDWCLVATATPEVMFFSGTLCFFGLSENKKFPEDHKWHIITQRAPVKQTAAFNRKILISKLFLSSTHLD